MSKESDSLAVGDEITPYTMKSIIYLNNIKHFLESGSVLILGKNILSLFRLYNAL